MDIQQVFTYVFGALIVLVPLFALYRCLVNPQVGKVDKLLWGIGILIIPVFGGLVYLFMNEVPKERL
ncbi:Phospholipase_D-nuclease N-terminal [Sphingobacterium nematocida]|uniref:Phospholipase_D-nuclease N-terminal n=1 Tax=Sphingobacterium nematocida TaxID=1513896 RepID=A0A1T5EZT6_9SPHI|nr:PLDc N-terminal domain-containing protein [Sphingobacterium nematocida]SKB89399.1 Phospholipase_D-nuclease N-terminal [Sphingobacterium nematocida]